MLRRLFNWVKGFFRKERPFTHRYVRDVPRALKHNTIYLIGVKECYWQMVMLCPCGCKAVLHMNLMEGEKPCWSYDIGKTGLMTIRPSIHRIVGCKSHFFIREGKVTWT